MVKMKIAENHNVNAFLGHADASEVFTQPAGRKPQPFVA
jgi:hypothetical protein